MDHMTPAQVLISSLLLGGGAFGGAKLLQEGVNKVSPKPKQEDNALNIDVPVQKVGNDLEEDPRQQLYKWIAGLGGVPLGFLGTKHVYDSMKKNQIDQDTERQKQQYLQSLSSFKTASATPTLDGFIDSYISHLEKEASATPLNQVDLSSYPSHQYNSAVTDVLNQGLPRRLASTMTLGATDHGLNAMGMTAIMAALLTGGAMLHADKSKEDATKSRAYPTGVKLNPVSVPGNVPSHPHGTTEEAPQLMQ